MARKIKEPIFEAFLRLNHIDRVASGILPFYYLDQEEKNYTEEKLRSFPGFLGFLDGHNGRLSRHNSSGHESHPVECYHTQYELARSMKR